MLKHLTIRQRLLLIFVVIVLLGSTVQFVIAGKQLEFTTLEFYQHHLETDALTIATSLSEPLEQFLDGEGEGSLSVINTMAVFQKQPERSYLIVDYQYGIISKTANFPYEPQDNQTVMPELRQAQFEQLGADVRFDQLYVAAAVTYKGIVIGYVVMTKPMQPAYDEVTQRYIGLAASTVPVLALVIIASLWISGTISRPIQQLRDSALHMAHGELDTRIAVMSSDELGELGKSFNYMAGQIETLLKTQRSFVSNAAHELRTPLMTLKLRAEALSDETLPAAERETYLQEIRQEVDHMAGLVSSLLTLARIDEGRHPTASANSVTDSGAILHDIARRWRIQAEAKGLRFDAHIPPDLPDLSIGANDLRIVLDNLLSNAIKYTAHGTVGLRAEQVNGKVTLTVSDSGEGFLPEQSAHLFERFYRSEQVRGKFPGTGLGLAVVKAILDHYDGRISATSAGLGKGSTFTINL